jgi:alpha,alpha-trehalose phosphorylase
VTWTDPLDRGRFPADEWALLENGPGDATSQTLFNVANGHLGIRPGSGQTFLNGFHETYRIQHPEDAYGLARIGQVIWPVPDGTNFQVSVAGTSLDDCPLLSRTRHLDFRAGELVQEDVRELPSGQRVRLQQTWLVSLTRPGLAATTISVEAGAAEVAIAGPLTVATPQQSRHQECDSNGDPRQAELPITGGLEPLPSSESPEGTPLSHPRVTPGHPGIGRRMPSEARDLGTESRATPSPTFTYYRCHNSRLGVVVGVQDSTTGPQLTRYLAYAGTPFTPDGKLDGLAVTTDEDLSPLEADCRSTLNQAPDLATLRAEQSAWLADFWERSDVRVELDDPQRQLAIQQAIRFELFQLAQAGAALGEQGIPAKGLSGSGYSGHYFWDEEIYVLPFLTYTHADQAKQVLRFRHRMLPAAKRRAAELNLRGALYPWRTINGAEASAYFLAGTAQYHISADIAYAVQQYLTATGDEAFLEEGGAEILTETARLWADLGFWGADGHFHIHGVTGPDEYSALVDDNYYTNAMARHNLRSAIAAQPSHPHEWQHIADSIHLGSDDRLGIHAQDAQFLHHPSWPTAETKRPLLLNYHPLVIYRHQVIKQADLVLTLHLLGHEFTDSEKRADFAYYDPLTTGDSTLSAATQAIIAAEIGESDLAERYFEQALFVDLADLHHNTADGIHLASAGGVWLALVAGFGGLRDSDGEIHLTPHLPPGWKSLTFTLTTRGNRQEYHFRA